MQSLLLLRNLLSTLSNRKWRIKENHARVYMFQLASALQCVHHYNIVHRDVKPENILINTKTRQLKLGDFGSAKELVPGNTNCTYICSRYYRAPECILDRDLYGFEMDMWSYRCVLA